MIQPERSTVWVVDDSPLDAHRIRLALAADHDVEVMHDGSAVLERLAAESGPDVLVLDWLMPGVSGVDVCRFLRGANPHAIQLLLLTVQNASEQLVEGLAAGADDFVTKPFRDSELRARVSALARTRSLIQRVRRAEGRLQELLAGSPDALLAFDRDLTITYVSPGASAVFPDFALGRRLDEVLPDLDINALRVALCGARVRMPDVALGDRVFAPRLGTSPTGQATLVLTDVSEHRRLEARRGTLYTTLAHDLRSPLNSILLRTEIALAGGRGLVSAELMSDLRRVQRMVQDQVGMINDFLELARLDEPSLKIDRETVDLCEVLRQTIDDLEPLATSRGVVLALDSNQRADAFGDRRRLLQVAANLIGNAIKFTPRGGRVVARVELDGAFVRIVVDDTGAGVDPAVADSLFEPRSGRETNRDDPMSGSGFGLPIVRQIVELHGGEVGFESRPREGSRFWFTIPRPPATIPPPHHPTTTSFD